jgi:uncharacterized protein YaiE (UPF0345 family)
MLYHAVVALTKESAMLKVNEYFEGKVKSIAFTSSDGPATAGVMAVGGYEFGTSTKEIMIVTSGLLKVKLPGAADWREFKPYERFEVAANQKFQLEVPVESSYICLYG